MRQLVGQLRNGGVRLSRWRQLAMCLVEPARHRPAVGQCKPCYLPSFPHSFLSDALDVPLLCIDLYFACVFVFCYHPLLRLLAGPSLGFCVCANSTPVQYCCCQHSQQQRSALPQRAASTAPLLSAGPRSLPIPGAQWPLPGPAPPPHSCKHQEEGYKEAVSLYTRDGLPDVPSNVPRPASPASRHRQGPGRCMPLSWGPGAKQPSYCSIPCPPDAVSILSRRHVFQRRLPARLARHNNRRTAAAGGGGSRRHSLGAAGCCCSRRLRLGV